MTRTTLVKTKLYIGTRFSIGSDSTKPLAHLNTLIKRLISHLNFVDACCGTPLFLSSAILERPDQSLANRFFDYFKVGLIKFADAHNGVFYIRTLDFEDTQPPNHPFICVHFNLTGRSTKIEVNLDPDSAHFLFRKFPEIGLFRDLHSCLFDNNLPADKAEQIQARVESHRSERLAFESAKHLIVQKTTLQRPVMDITDIENREVVPVFLNGYAFAKGTGSPRYVATWGLLPCVALVLSDRQRQISSLAHFYSQIDIPWAIKIILELFGRTQLSARIIGGQTNASEIMIWDIRRTLPEHVTIDEEDILGNSQRDIFIDSKDGVAYDLKGYIDYSGNAAVRQRLRQVDLFAKKQLFVDGAFPKNHIIM